MNRARKLMLPAVLAALVFGSASAQELPEALTDTTWWLEEFQSMSDAIGTQQPDDPSRYTLTLNADGSASMQLNCNRGAGTWSAAASGAGTSGSFEFGPIAMTRALCPPPSMDESIARQAEYIRSFVLEDGRLYLSLMADGGIYAWVPEPVAPMVAPEQGGPRVFAVTGVTSALNMRLEPSTEAPIVGRLGPGALLDNLGCREAPDRTWCDVQTFGGGPRAWVAADYLAGAVGPDGDVALGPDDSALRAGMGKFDASGDIPCAQAAGQPMSSCQFAVARAGGGFATVVVTLPDDRERLLFFRLGVPTGAGTSEASPRGEFSASNESDLHLIRLGDERYEIPYVVVLGD